MESLLIAGKTICLPFKDEEHYRLCMQDRRTFRHFLTDMYGKHPETFPQAMAEGFALHGFTTSKKQRGFRMRRIRLSNGAAYQVRPSLMMPHMIGKTAEVEKALYLCRFGVPFEALTHVFGRNPMYWYRAYLALGRLSIVGTTIKDPDLVPVHLVADEKHTRFNGQKAYVTTTVARGCILGVGIAESAGTESLTRGYSHFKEEAQNLCPGYKPETVNTDGWEPTQMAWSRLFPDITLILCFLHAYLKIRDRCKKCQDLFAPVKGKIWGVYRATSLSQFSQRIRRLREWAQCLPEGPVRDKVLDLCHKAPEFKKSFSHPECHRTSAMLDRLMSYQDQMLYCMHYFHGTWVSALLYLRSMALLWNFHPYGTRARHPDLRFRASPFEEINGFHYHPNWLHNMLVAASLGGWRT